jgi:50S ribosomal subunit-associated GTPase HflX
VVVINKTELLTDEVVNKKINSEPLNVILEMISAKQNIGIEELKTNYCLLSIPELYAIMRQSLQ